MRFPLISIVIPTFNSGKTLEKTLESIKGQSYPSNKIEVLIIDGGSKDMTLPLAKKYKCRVVGNPKTELVFGKHLGFLKAKGEYLLFLDSDELLENPESLKIKVSVFQRNKGVRAVMPSGYKTPYDCAGINYYINEFGDPFSFFMYRESKDFRFLLTEFSKKYKEIYRSKKFVIFDFSKSKHLPLIELWAGGCMVDLEYIRRSLPQLESKAGLIAHIFYLLNSKGGLLAVTRNDPTVHCSVEGLSKYLKKISSRVKNNVFGTFMGEGGFSGREQFEDDRFQLRKYLFIPYALLLILPALDSVYLSISRKKLLYLAHLPLSAYTALLILFYSALKIVGFKPEIGTYGN